MSIFVVGDTHWGVGDEQKIYDLYATGKAKAGDTVIICGDAGIVWGSGDKKVAKQISQLPFDIIYALGNHENYHKLNCGRYSVVYYQGAKCHMITDNCYQVENGEFMVIEGKKFWFCGGAASTDKALRHEGYDWWAEEVPKDWQINKFYDKILEVGEVDYIISHQCPKWVEKELYRSIYDCTVHADAYLTRMFDEVYKEIAFTTWFCGHHHVDQKFDKVEILYDKVVQISD